MAEGAAAAACFSEDDFYCPVCQEVFKTPVRTANCQHVWVFLPAAPRRAPPPPSQASPSPPPVPCLLLLHTQTTPHPRQRARTLGLQPAGQRGEPPSSLPPAAPGAEEPPPSAGVKACLRAECCPSLPSPLSFVASEDRSVRKASPRLSDRVWRPVKTSCASNLTRVF